MENLTKEIILSELKKRENEFKSKFHVKNLFLFGSYAKDKQKENSDIDFLVDFEKDYVSDISNELDFQVYLYNLFRKDIGLCERERIRKEYVPYIINENLIDIC